MALNVLPGIGDTLAHESGTATIIDMRLTPNGDIVVLGLWSTEAAPFATWLYDPIAARLYSGHYFAIRDAAEQDYEDRT